MMAFLNVPKTFWNCLDLSWSGIKWDQKNAKISNPIGIIIIIFIQFVRAMKISLEILNWTALSIAYAF